MNDLAPTENAPEGYYRAVLYAITGLIVLAGVYFRFKGLGRSPFAIDEYYIATSVNSILEHGLPRFECGGFYVRGILLQYLVAPLFLTDLSQEFAFRLVTVLSNLAALPAVYLLARHMGGVLAGCVALILFSLALWEVEFARFARMYAPLGTLFLWHLYFVYRNAILDDGRAIRWMYLLSFVAIFVSEFAIFLVLVNFLPFVVRPRRRSVVEYTLPPLLLGLTLFFERTDFRRMGVGDYLPPDWVGTGAPRTGLPVEIPPVLLAPMSGSLLWSLAFLVPLLLAGVVAGLWVRRAARGEKTPAGREKAPAGRGEDPARRGRRLFAVVPVGLLFLALLNLFGLVVYALVILFLLSGLSRRELPALVRDRLVRLTALSLAVSLAFWAAFVASTDSWLALLETGSRLRGAVRVLFNYPDVHLEVILQWLYAMPLQTVLMAGLVAVGVWLASARNTPGDRAYRMSVAVVVALCLVVAAGVQMYSTTRYTYPLYPVVLVLCAVTLARVGMMLSGRAWVGGAAALAMTGGLMIVSEDFDARHLLEIDGEQAMFRIGYGAGKVDQYYQRWDYRGPAEVIEAGRQQDDIVISTEYSVPHYLSRLDFLYIDQEDGRFEGISGCGGTREIWEGTPLLRTPETLFRQITEADRTVWLVARSERYDYQVEAEEAASELLEDFRVYRTVDGHLDVYRITPGDAPPLEAFLRSSLAGALRVPRSYSPPEPFRASR